MRQHFTPYTHQEKQLWRAIKKMMDETKCTIAQAGAAYGLDYNRARQIMARSYPTPLEMRERRKGYIERIMLDPKRRQRTSPYIISKFFLIDESFVQQMIQELRDEGRLPKGESNDLVERNNTIRKLQRHYPNVYRAETVGKLREVGDKLYVAGKGWMTWPDASALAAGLK